MDIGTLMSSSHRGLILERLRRVRPETSPAWGSLDAPRMLCHVADMMRIALGDLPTKHKHSFLLS